jgi:hypothetical protein
VELAKMLLKLLFILTFVFVLTGCNNASLYTDETTYTADVAEISSSCSTATTTGFHAGNGSISAPFQICKIEHLDILREKMILEYGAYFDKHYILTDNIDLEGGSLVNFYPIGDIYDITIGDYSTPPNSKPFQGKFNGNNKVLSNFYLDAPGIPYVGLFQYLGDLGEVKDLTIKFYFNFIEPAYFVGPVAGYSRGEITNVKSFGIISGDEVNVVGLLAGYHSETTLDNNIVAGQILTADGVQVGGLVGSASNVTIGNNILLSSYGTIISESSISGSSMVGGVVGYADDTVTITNLNNNFKVSGTGDYTGGFVGYASSTIDLNNLNNYADVSGVDYVGGIVGYATDGAITTVENDAAVLTKTITGRSSVGGIVGYGNEVVITSATNEYFVVSTIDNADSCWGDFPITCATSNVGGIAGYLSESTLTLSLNDEDIFGGSVNIGPFIDTEIADYVGGLVGYAITDVVISSSNSTGDIFGVNNVGGVAGYVESNFDLDTLASSGRVLATGNYIGGSIGQLVNSGSADSLDVNIILNPSITGSSNVGGVIGKVSNSLVTDNIFLDDLNSDVSKITGIGNIGGAIGHSLNNVFMSNLTIETDLEVFAGGTYYVGGVVGTMENAVGFSSVMDIADFADKGAGIISNRNAGGIVGYARNGNIISNITSETEIYCIGGFSGGGVAKIEGSTISDISLNTTVQCYTTAVPSGNRIGGLAGESLNSTINKVTIGDTNGAAYDLVAQSDIGGIVGLLQNSNIFNSSTEADIRVTAATAGGAAGAVDGSTLYNVYSHGTITANTGVSIWDGGGLVGNLRNSSTINNSFSTGSIAGFTANMGGSVGNDDGSNTVNTLVWDIGSSGQGASAAGVGHSTVNMGTSAPYVGFDFFAEWNYPTGTGTYPTLK